MDPENPVVLSRARKRECCQDMEIDKGHCHQDDDSWRIFYQHSNEGQYNFEVRFLNSLNLFFNKINYSFIVMYLALTFFRFLLLQKLNDKKKFKYVVNNFFYKILRLIENAGFPMLKCN